MKRSICLSIFLFLFSLLHAQEKLGRKPWFGAQFASNDEGKKKPAASSLESVAVQARH
jgi:hypothetical protein